MRRVLRVNFFAIGTVRAWHPEIGFGDRGYLATGEQINVVAAVVHDGDIRWHEFGRVVSAVVETLDAHAAIAVAKEICLGHLNALRAIASVIHYCLSVLRFERLARNFGDAVEGYRSGFWTLGVRGGRR